MPDTLHTRLLAALDERLERARAEDPRWRLEFVCCGRADGHAEYGSWAAADAAREAYCTGPGVDPRGCSGDGRTGHQRAAKLAAANDPTTEIRRVEALRRVVERHRPVHRWTTDYCKCGGDWVCDDIRDLAAGEGIEVGE